MSKKTLVRLIGRDQIAVVIPARNEVASIHSLAQACLEHAQTVIIVDDASTDGTADALRSLPVTVLRGHQWLGKGAALAWGFRAALEQGALAIITLDGDGQHDPADIPAFIDAARRFPSHLILGARLKNLECAPRGRLVANRIADFCISWAAGQAIRDSQCGHRLYPRELLATVQPQVTAEDGFVFESEILIESARRGFDIVAVPIESRYPANARPSHFRPGYDIWRITCMVAGKIVPRAMYLSGLARSLLMQPKVCDRGLYGEAYE
jgi:glycosyltransferase involved in cell wall biosynthesis